MSKPLKIVLILDDPNHPEDWSIRLIERIVRDPQLKLLALVRSDSRTTRPSTNFIVRGWESLERMIAARPCSADREAYAATLSTMDNACSSDSAFLAGLSPDVILDLSLGEGAGIDPALARHGVWFPDVPDVFANLATIAAGAPTSRIALFRRTMTSAKPIAVDEAELNPKFVAARNALFMKEKLVTLIMRALRRTRLYERPDTLEDIAPSLRGTPKLGDLLRYLQGLGLHVSRRIKDRIYSKAGLRPGMFYLKSGQGTWQDFDTDSAEAHLPETNSYYADPFLWERDGEVFCFFEEYDYQTKRGHISVGRLANGQLTGVEPALKTDYHLSFPFLFESGDVLFMLPETHQRKRIEVWKCEKFPNRWVRHSIGLEGVTASDSTLNMLDGEWWLFTNISNDPFLDMNTELHIFRVDGPDLMHIEPHAANPVVMDTNRARNAGRIFEIGGRRLRPAQENSHGAYGYGFKMMEIRQLSLDQYEEVEVRSIKPATEAGIVGCHHFDTRSGLVIMDACQKVGGHAR